MMRADEVAEGLVEKAERTLAFGICDDNRLDGKCDCPTDEQIRVIIAAVLPKIQAQAVKGERAKRLHAERSLKEMKRAMRSLADTWDRASEGAAVFADILRREVRDAARRTAHTTDQIRKEHHL